MKPTPAQAAVVEVNVLKKITQLIECLTENKTDPQVGEVALVLLAGTSAGHAMRPLTKILIPVLYAGWEGAVKNDNGD